MIHDFILLSILFIFLNARIYTFDLQQIEYVPWNNRSQDITIRCYALYDSFESEKECRDTYELSNDYFENVLCYYSYEIKKLVNNSIKLS